MRIPESVRIGPFDYKVERGAKWKEDAMGGYIDHNLLDIRIAAVDVGGCSLSPQREFEIFIHEVNHGIDYVYNQGRISDHERGSEKTIVAFGLGWAQVLRDNDFDMGTKVFDSELLQLISQRHSLSEGRERMFKTIIKTVREEEVSDGKDSKKKA